MFRKYKTIYLKRSIPIHRHFKYRQLCLFTRADRAPQTFYLCDSSAACVWWHEVCSLLSVWGKWTQRERRRPTDGSRNTPQDDRRDEGKRKRRGRTEWGRPADGVWWRAVDLVLLLCSIRPHEQEKIKQSERGEAPSRELLLIASSLINAHTSTIINYNPETQRERGSR